MNRKPRFRRAFEVCEPRRALAGDVAVALEGSLMMVFGDDLANDIAVEQSAAGDVTIRGRQGTTVNGGPAVTLTNPMLNAVEIRMNAGNDRVNLLNVSAFNDLNVHLGDGDDQFTSIRGSAQNYSLYGEQGADRAHVGRLDVQGDLNIHMGIGAASVSVANSNVGFNLNIVTDDAADAIAAGNTTVGGGLDIQSKGGADTVTLNAIAALTAKVSTDLGNDRVRLTALNTVEDLNIETGDGNDQITLTDVVSNKNISVNAAGGQDIVVATRVAAAYDAVFAGGAGTDTFDDNGVTAGVKREIKEFEILI